MRSRSGGWKAATPLTIAVLWGGCAAGPAEVETTWADLEERAHRSLEDSPLDATEAPRAWSLEGATVMTATGTTFAPGRVVLEEGRITWVGPAGEGPACEACRTVDLTGRWITPGLIDTHSHLGVYPSPGLRAHADGNEMVAPTTPGAWAEHAVWPQDPGFARAVAGGITTLQILPGSANLIGGRGVVMRPIPARGSRAMRFEGAPETVKMACGENPKRVYGDRGGPQTRMGNVRGYRDAFLAAERYRDGWEEGDAPDQDLDLDTLKGILDGDFLPQVHCYRADDMLGFLQVADEFGFEVRSFHHALEAYKIRDILAERDVSVSTWADWWGFKAEAYDAVEANAALVHVAGGRAIIHSDSAIGIQRLNQEAGKALRAGREAGLDVDEADALTWITLQPAWALGVDDVTGSLEAGKLGDVTVWDGPPLSVYSRATHVFVEGVLAFDAQHPPAWSDVEIGQEVNR